MHQRSFVSHPDYLHRRLTRALSVFTLAALLAGCGPFGSSTEATPVPTRTPLPTFTPTPLAQPTPAPPTTAPVQAEAAAAPTTAPTTAAPTATPPAEARLTVAGDIVNVRSGPATTFDLMGTANPGESFKVVAKSAAGDWWQVCCIADQPGWIFGELATVENGDTVAVATDLPAAAPTTAAVAEAPTAVPAAAEPTATTAPAPVVAYDPTASSAGNFDPNAQYQITQFRVLGLDENNGGIRDSSAQHLIFLTVLDQNGNGVDGAVVKNLVGNEKGEVVTGNKGPGKAEITMYYEPFKLTVASDPSGPVTSQVSNQMGLIFPHLPDLVGKLGDVTYEYGACPTLEIKCQWPLSAIHFSYEITFQKVK